jgi:DNA-binding response OmpR family regulator
MAARHAKPRLLLIDDEKSMRLVLKAELMPLGLEIDTAADGAEGLKLIDEREYSLVLIDLCMPEMDGLEVLRRVRLANAEIPVILLTAHGSVTSAVTAMKLGATDFLEKPMQPEPLRQVVQKALAPQPPAIRAAQSYAHFFELAKEHVAKQELKAAESVARRAVSLDPERPEAFNLLGASFELRHNINEALKHYRIALDVDATYVPARKNLDRVVTVPGRRGRVLLGELVARRNP